MTFKLYNVVPWGRNFDEYSLMFQLCNGDRAKKIASFGDGPSSFNYEATQKGYSIFSFDPIYQFSKEELQNRIEEVRKIVMKQVEENKNNYIWNNIKDLNELENLRISAMRVFLEDYNIGRKQGRYVEHELPNRLQIKENSFDMGLSSHFLLLYTKLGYDFHIKAISEMLRVCKEVRIFPILDLNSEQTELIFNVIEYFNKRNNIEIRETSYEFQKNGNKLLIIH